MGLGMPEVLLILVIALIVFGPRKLPELGKSMGQAMAQFRKASEDFKRTWEQEVEVEKTRTSGGSAGDSSYSYNSYDSNDPYNPYANDEHSNESHGAGETAQLPAASSENAVAHDAAHAVPAAEAGSKKQWI